MSKNISLLAFIQAKNEETAAWIAAGPNRFAGFYPEDLEHWAESDVFTAEDLIKYELKVDIYEGIKVIFGYKTSWARLANMSLQELQGESQELNSHHQAQERAKRERQKETVRKANAKALVKRKLKQKINKSFSLAAAFEFAGA